MSAADPDICAADAADGAANERPVGKRSRKASGKSSATSRSTDPIESPAIAARRAAMNWLARREHSFHELLQKLEGKFPDVSRAEVLIPALQQLQHDNLQSDARFAEAFVRYRSTRGCGPLKIAAELQPRKLDSELLKAVLYDSGPDWEALCMAALRKKFRLAAKPTADERLRWQRFLQQRGFEHGQIRATFKALQTVPADAE
jgi:regulatory protein